MEEYTQSIDKSSNNFLWLSRLEQFQAPLMIIFLLMMYSWRTMIWGCIKYRNVAVPLCLQSYFIFYIGLGLFVAAKIHHTYCSVMYTTDWLDAAKTAQVAMARGAINGTMWEEEASLEDSPLLKWFSLLTPVWTLCTYIVCVFHTWRHHQARHVVDEQQHSRRKHDLCITVGASPMVYGVMALQAVTNSWQAITNYQDDLDSVWPWQRNLEKRNDMYDSAFLVGDFYESLTVWLFSQALLNVIFVQVKAASERLRSTVEAAAPAQQQDNYQPPNSAGLDLREPQFQGNTLQAYYGGMFNVIEMLGQSTQELTTIGIKYFCIVCAFQAYEVPLVMCNYFSIFPEWIALAAKYKNAISIFLSGAGFIASCAAIENLVRIESKYGAKFLSSFNPTRKFWSVKILVSLSFLQRSIFYVLQIRGCMSATKVNLFYASAISLECFCIAIFNCWAWQSNEGWFKIKGQTENGRHQKFFGASDRGPSRPLLEGA